MCIPILDRSLCKNVQLFFFIGMDAMYCFPYTSNLIFYLFIFTIMKVQEVYFLINFILIRGLAKKKGLQVLSFAN